VHAVAGGIALSVFSDSPGVFSFPHMHLLFCLYLLQSECGGGRALTQQQKKEVYPHHRFRLCIMFVRV